MGCSETERETSLGCESPAERNGFGKLGPVAVELPRPSGRALPAGLPGRWGKQLDGQVAGLGFQPCLDF